MRFKRFFNLNQCFFQNPFNHSKCLSKFVLCSCKIPTCCDIYENTFIQALHYIDYKYIHQIIHTNRDHFITPDTPLSQQLHYGHKCHNCT